MERIDRLIDDRDLLAAKVFHMCHFFGATLLSSLKNLHHFNDTFCARF